MENQQIRAEIHQPTFRKGYSFTIDGKEVFFYRTPLCGAHIRELSRGKYIEHCNQQGVKP